MQELRYPNRPKTEQVTPALEPKYKVLFRNGVHGQDAKVAIFFAM